MVFPVHTGGPIGYLNANECVRAWNERNYFSAPQGNPFNDPVFCAEQFAIWHEERGLKFSYGGWMEDRSLLWRGSYLEKDQKFIHLGVDFNAPAGTHICADTRLRVRHILNDHPLMGGWGTYLIAEVVNTDMHLLYGHIDPQMYLREGEYIERGQIFAHVGREETNGNWYSHVHIQALSGAAYELFLSDRDAFDGYGKAEDLGALATLYPDPLPLLNVP